MKDEVKKSDQIGASCRLNAGIGMFILSIITPLCGIPAVTLIGLSTSATVSISGVLLVGSEVLGILAIAVMGKDGYAFLKNSVAGFFKQYGPPQTVNRIRYNIGLVLFSVPILFAWVSVYIGHSIPFHTENPIIFAIAGDIILLTSFIVLGGDFWDKVRALFVHSDKVCTTSSL